MKKIIIKILFFFILSQPIFSQIGVGTTMPEGALDVSSSTNGIIIPRVSLISKTLSAPVVNPNGSVLVNGTLVYNIATAGISPNNVAPGFYYWDTTSWTSIVGNGSGWLLTGNSGINSGVNFLGTLDSADLFFRRNNVKSGQINTSSTGFGFRSLLNTTGSNNTAFGVDALMSVTTAFNSTAIGNRALALSTGSDNVAVGSVALENNTTGTGNIAVGGEALRANTTGTNNTSLGLGAMLTNTTGSSNVAIGQFTLARTFTGNLNTAVGFQADTSNSNGANFINSTSLGANSVTNASNKVRIGDSTITIVQGQVAYSSPSDARFKYNIKQNVPGLSFIKQLRPVTYKFDTYKFDQYLLQNFTEIERKERMSKIDYSESSTVIHTGFLAQDVQKVCTDLDYDFDGLHVPDPKNSTDNYSLAYSQFIMPLIKAVQEQQIIIENQNNEIAKIKIILNELIKK